MADDTEAAAWVALSVGNAAYISGSARVSVLAGAVDVLGAQLCEGESACIVSPLHEASVPMIATTSRDVRMSEHVPEAVNLALRSEATAAAGADAGAGMMVGSSFQRALLAVRPLLVGPESAAAASLRASAAASGLSLDAASLAVRGALLLRSGPEMLPLGGGSSLIIAADSATAASDVAAAVSARRSASGRISTARLTYPALWTSALASICKRAAAVPADTVIFVLGAKGAGKSTFARILVNRLLCAGSSRTGVAYLDLDVGQPEHVPPGMLSLTLVHSPLLSPPHVRVAHTAASAAEATRIGVPHALEPAVSLLAARYFGDDSPAADPALFCAAARELFAERAAHSTASNAPLVVNCHGWLRGAGHTTLQDALLAMRPSDVVFLDSSAGGSGRGSSQRVAPVAFSSEDGVAEAAAAFGVLAVPDSTLARIHIVPAWHVAGGVSRVAATATSDPDVEEEEDQDEDQEEEEEVDEESAAAAVQPSAEETGGQNPADSPTSPLRSRGVSSGRSSDAATDDDEDTGGDAQRQQAAAARLPRNIPPPRAARSPADGRGARMLIYFLWGAAAAIARYPEERLGVLPASLTVPADAAAALRVRARRARAACLANARATLAAVLADERAARTPTFGGSSPAYFAAACPAAIIGLAKVRLLPTPSDTICACGGACASAAAAPAAFAASPASAGAGAGAGSGTGGDAGGMDAAVAAAKEAAKEEIARGIEGQVVGLLCGGGGSSGGGGGGGGSSGCARVPGGQLPCIGLAYVRKYDARLRELHLLTPLSPSALSAAGVNVLAAWRGAHDIPAQLLCRFAPGGDPFFMEAADIVRAGGAAPGKTGGRKHLKRGE